MKDPFALAKLLNPRVDDILEKKKLDEQNEKSKVSRQFYCHGCNQWIPCKDDFTPYDCPVCHKSRWGD